MNVDEIKNLLVDFAKKHKTTFSDISSRESQLLELGAMVAVREHYKSNKFTTEIWSPNGSSTFIVKNNTRGHPAKYSKIIASRAAEVVEIHMNLLVGSAHDTGIYCVDIGITKEGVVPNKVDKKNKWICLHNNDLLSLAEVKRLKVYPMLLAQFLGIVHEIKPSFLKTPTPLGFDQFNHLPPTLVSLGHFSGNSKEIVSSYKSRGIGVCIAESFDVRVAAHRKGTSKSPLFWDATT